MIGYTDKTNVYNPVQHGHARAKALYSGTKNFFITIKKDMIITGGENVYPREVEEILYRHPAISEASVIGLPDPYWVEKVHAVVVLKKGMSATQEEIIRFCKGYLAGYKTPKSVEFVSSLPKDPQGKILKREIREERSSRSIS